jgi:hypothetical protein
MQEQHALTVLVYCAETGQLLHPQLLGLEATDEFA